MNDDWKLSSAKEVALSFSFVAALAYGVLAIVADANGCTLRWYQHLIISCLSFIWSPILFGIVGRVCWVLSKFLSLFGNKKYSRFANFFLRKVSGYDVD